MDGIVLASIAFVITQRRLVRGKPLKPLRIINVLFFINDLFIKNKFIKMHNAIKKEVCKKMRKRDILFQHWLNAKEAKRLRDYSKLTGMNASEFIRNLINGYIPLCVPPMDYFTLIKELRAIGNNMHQIAQRANSMKFIDAPYYRKNAGRVLEVCDYIFSLHLPVKESDIDGYNKNLAGP